MTPTLFWVKNQLAKYIHQAPYSHYILLFIYSRNTLALSYSVTPGKHELSTMTLKSFSTYQGLQQGEKPTRLQSEYEVKSVSHANQGLTDPLRS